MAEAGCLKDGHFQNLEISGNIVKNGTMNRIKVNGSAHLHTLAVTEPTTLYDTLAVTGATTLSDTLAVDDNERALLQEPLVSTVAGFVTEADTYQGLTFGVTKVNPMRPMDNMTTFGTDAGVEIDQVDEDGKWRVHTIALIFRSVILSQRPQVGDIVYIKVTGDQSAAGSDTPMIIRTKVYDVFISDQGHSPLSPLSPLLTAIRFEHHLFDARVAYPVHFKIEEFNISTGGTTSLRGSLAVAGATTLSDTLGVTGTTSLKEDLDVRGELTIANLATTTLSPTAGAGIPGNGGFYNSSVVTIGNIIYTTIFLDLTGMRDPGVKNTIIGNNEHRQAKCHIGEIKAGVSGTIFGGRMTCLVNLGEIGATRLELLSSPNDYGQLQKPPSFLEDGTRTLLENAELGSGIGEAKTFANLLPFDPDRIDCNPSPFMSCDTQYLYLLHSQNADPATTDPADYTQGRILIEMWGYDATSFPPHII